MTQEFFAVVGCTIGHGLGSTITGGVFTIASAPSIDVVAGAFMYRGPLTFTFAGGSAPGCVPGSVTGAGTINPTSTKNLANALPPVREGDTGTLIGSGTTQAPPPPTTPVSGPVEVAAAGQTKAKGE